MKNKIFNFYVDFICKKCNITRQQLFLKTKHTIPKLGYKPTLKYGDGYEGWEAYAPFSKIIPAGVK